MSLLGTLSVFINCVIIALLAGIAWYASELLKLRKREWPANELMRSAVEDSKKSSDEILAFLKLTLNKDFAAKLEDVIRVKENIPQTVRRLCDDGQYHEVPVDHGW